MRSPARSTFEFELLPIKINNYGGRLVVGSFGNGLLDIPPVLCSTVNAAAATTTGSIPALCPFGGAVEITST